MRSLARTFGCAKGINRLCLSPSSSPPRVSRCFYGQSLTLLRTTGQIESNYDETVDSFDEMNLKPELLRGIYAYGFERPSAIQQRAIMPVIKGMCDPLFESIKHELAQLTMSRP